MIQTQILRRFNKPQSTINYRCLIGGKKVMITFKSKSSLQLCNHTSGDLDLPPTWILRLNH